jgi:hypothetical protein
MIGSGSLSSSGLHGFCRETQSMMEIPGLLKCLSTSRDLFCAVSSSSSAAWQAKGALTLSFPT